MCLPVSKTNFNWLSAQLKVAPLVLTKELNSFTQKIFGGLTDEITTDDVLKTDGQWMVGQQTDDWNLRLQEGYQLIVT